ncbi:MAG TPA: GNAT family N-acetyltransferase [Chloroflexi bacterium]|nr:GNAT family N-acetyltransferase [Chloroflexota bacterium]HPO57841.1 GNAT family N-acetyltransferase [Anaerolineaceae bacterium]
MSTEVVIRRLEISDLKAVAEVHSRAFPDSALTRLGLEAVRRYYEWQLTGPHQVTPLGAFTGERLVGFCFGGRFQGALNGFLRKNRSYLLGQVLRKPWLLANPLFRDRAIAGLKNLFRRKRVREVAVPVTGKVYPFGILSIAVDPQGQGKGVGRALMAVSEEAARQQGFREMILTVHPDNEPAVRFYQSLNWHPVQENGFWKGEMRKELL